jgi:hypothetical protein
MLAVIQDCYEKLPGKYLGIVGNGHIESEIDQWTGEDSLETQMAKNFHGTYITLPLKS